MRLQLHQQVLISEISSNEIKISIFISNAQNGVFINSVSNLDEFNIISRVSDKKPNDAGHPIQYDGTQNSGLFIQASW